ncbi:translation initiation factor eIF2B subunit epsilon-like [Scylla paramamosain]|uniref:translation initiation factor eIF2B subunit epsilon-like n=1 Tax=Scylla paramamosain TaxID=85552 RepID=UPI0030833BED
MAPKAEIHEEQVLQAVILAQCEQDYGDPVTQDVPKVLAPLANTPLLEYSLEWLERCGVEEAIVYCRADTHLETIREHCRAFMTRRGDTTPATTHPGGLRVNVVASEDCHSLGDAMRDLYAKSLLKGDFILLQGDTVTTLDLPALVTEHRESRAADRNAIMTCVYMGEGGKVGTTAEKTTTATLLVSASTNKLLLHRRRGGRSTSSRLSVPTELLQGAGDILAYPAAYDPSVTICSEVVPSLFSDNFDYSTLDSLVRGVIEQEELLGYTIKCRVLEGGYAGRAASINSLIGVSGEVVGRQAYPLVPEVSQTSHRVRYHHDAFTHTYWDPSAKFPKGSMVTGVVVGAGTEVSPTAHLQNTTLGDHCTLGDGVVVRESVVMTGVCVKAASKLEQCWVGDNVVLGEGVVVAPGCVIGAGGHPGGSRRSRPRHQALCAAPPW